MAKDFKEFKVVSILHRYTGATLWSGEAADLGDAAKRALAAGADLSCADLSYADLSCADLSYANLSDANLSDADLSDANLSRANLSDANLSDANLSRANLSDANLSRANLSRANLSRADLSDANLSRANLSDANLSDANLSRANLSDANLSPIKRDFYAVLETSPAEVPTLLAAVRAGNINGTIYEGDCACLIGTIANARGCAYSAIPGLVPNADRLAERFFLALRPGDTPETSIVAKVVETWLVEWLASREVAQMAQSEMGST